MAKLRADERLALGTYVKLMRAAEAASGRVHKHLASAHLTASQFGVLEALLHLGALSQKDLGAKILKTSGNITLVIDNLERQELVTRERSNPDRRLVTVSLTEKGRRLIDEVFPRHAGEVARDMAVLTSEEQVELGRLCRKLGKQQSG